ncbi:MAG: hypothetical protein HFACDABA_02146 [Anaerolineales bacterium]|nr:hypothetical protein [Anaerolineales bacterium]
MRTLPPSRWDWLAAGLVLALVLIAAVRLAITEWTGFLYIGETTALLGTSLGLALGFSRLRPWSMRGMIVAYTVLLLPAQLTTLSETDLPLRETLAEIWLRFSAAAVTFWRGQKVDDSILFIAFIALAFWLVGLVSGFGLARGRNALTAILPSAFAILAVQAYDPLPASRGWQVALYFLIALLLIGRLYFLDNREAWNARRILQLPETQGDMNNGMLALALTLVLVAWNLPLSFSSLREAAALWAGLKKPFAPLRENIGRALDPLESAYGEREGGDFYGETLPLGRGLPLSNDLVFRVRVPETLEAPPPRFYWRGRTFATYDGTTWLNPEARRSAFDAEAGDLPIQSLEGREIGEFEIVNVFQQSMIYAPSQPVWSSLSGEMLVQPGAAETVDLVSLESSKPISPRTTYRVRAALFDPSIEELRAAGEEYPTWVTNRYLQLPPGFSPRIAELAREIAAVQTTPYDKADAVTKWLRANLEYQAVIPAPPRNVNALEWVLFEYKRGFCMYYATSEVAMLRALGVPARMAVGFAEGELDEETNTYTVRRKQYHAWPEVYFPGIGWVEFEPTANLGVIQRPLSHAPAVIVTAGPPVRAPLARPLEDEPADRSKDEEGLTPLTPWYVTRRVPVLWTLLALLVAALWLLERRTGWMGRIPLAIEARAERNGTQAPRWIRTWAAWARLSPVARSFEAVNLSLWLLGDAQPIHATPGERAARLNRLLPGMQARVQALTEQHALALYAGIPSNISGARWSAGLILLTAIWTRLLQWRRIFEERFSRPNSFR